MKSFQEIPMLYQDNDVLIVMKPAGLSTESGNASHPSAEAILRGQLSRVGRKEVYLRAVHRIDRPASGVLIFARKKAVLSLLMSAFERRQVQKTYIAVVTGNHIPDSGELSHWLKRDESGKLAVAFSAPTEGAHPATLYFKVLERAGSHTRLEVNPSQGRYHQIRVQLATAGWPIVGDTLYGGEPLPEPHTIRLHASQIAFEEELLAQEAVLSCPAPW